MHDWAGPFLRALAEGSTISEAAAAAGITSSAVYSRRKRDADFEEAYQTALEDSVDILEREARRRAVDGVEEPIYQGGQLVGTKTVYSDSLLALLLRGRRKEVFADRKEITGANGAPLPPSIVVATGVPADEVDISDIA